MMLPKENIAAFCDKYGLTNVEEGIDEFLKSKNVASYEAYCKDVAMERRLAKPQPEQYQRRVREWDPSTLPNAVSENSVIRAAGQSLSRAMRYIVAHFVLMLLCAIYLLSLYEEVVAGTRSLSNAHTAIMILGGILFFNFLFIVYHVSRANWRLKEM